ncbi:hypothetical protein [Novosphingobium sp.]|uniref:SRPBCC family protein n=1 Tax=Novosphingobium sp. TaxID=1874826 RepID=UPI0038BBF786
MRARNLGVAGARAFAILLAGGSFAVAGSAQADVVASADNGFVSRNAVEVTASPADVWRALIAPAGWWSDEHTFSGSAKNLSIDPVPGGCFCEKLPAKADSPRGGSVGGVVHMRVLYAEAGRGLRMSGALGPLQSEAVNATLTITIKPTEKGSRILWEYVVGGFMRYEAPAMAVSVDRVMAEQMASLAKVLGPAVLEAGEPVVRAPEAVTAVAAAASAEEAGKGTADQPAEPRASGRKAASQSASNPLPIEETRGAPGLAPRSGRVWSLPRATGPSRAAVAEQPAAVGPAAPNEVLRVAAPDDSVTKPQGSAKTVAATRSAKSRTRPTAAKVAKPAPTEASGANDDAVLQQVVAEPVAAQAPPPPKAPSVRKAAGATAVTKVKSGSAAIASKPVVARPVAAPNPGIDADSEGPAAVPATPKSPQSIAKQGAKSGAKPAKKPLPNRKNVEDKEREDANAAFDAALGGPP